MTVKSVDGKVIKIDGNPHDPKSRGMLCGRGQAGVSFLNDPDRLRSPMIRTGERGEGKFRELLGDDPEINKHLSVEELDSAFDLEHHLRHVDFIFERALKENA